MSAPTRLYTLATLPLACALLAVPAGAAEYTASVSQDLQHVSNPDRASAALARGDQLAVTQADFGAALPLGRHTWQTNATLGVHRYSDRSELNYNPYNLLSQLNWTAASNLAGKLGVRAAQLQNNFLQDGVTAVTGRNLQNTKAVYFDARYGLVSEWSVGVLGDWQAVRNNSTAVGTEDRRQSTLGALATWKPSPRFLSNLTCNKVRSELLSTGQSSDYTRCDLRGELTVLDGGSSSLNLSLGRSQFFSSANGDSGGWTGSARWVWTPSGKLTARLGAERTMGTNSDGQTLVSRDGTRTAELSTFGANTSDTFSAGLEWAALANVQASVNLSQSHRVSSSGYSLLGSTATRSTEDEVRNLNAQVRYSLTRQLSTGLTYTSEHRTPKDNLGTQAYDVNTLAAQVKYQFR